MSRFFRDMFLASIFNSYVPSGLVSIGVIACVNFIIGFYVIVQNLRSTVHRSFFLFVSGASLWGISIIFLFITDNFFFNQLIFLGGTIAVLGLLFLAKTFPLGSPIERRFWFHLIPFILLLVGIPLNVYVKGIAISSGGELQPINGFAFPFYAVTIGGYIAYSIFLLARSYAKLSGLARLQMQYFFFGATFFAFSALTFDVILPALRVFRLNLFGPISSVVFVSMTAYAIVRYQLLNIRIVVRSGILLAGLVGFVIGTYMFGALIVSKVFPGIFSFLLPAVAIVLLIRPTEEFLARITDRLLFQERHNSEEIFHNVTKALAGIVSTDELIDVLLERVTRPLHILRASVVILEGSRYGMHRSFGTDLDPVSFEEKGTALIKYLTDHPDHIVVERALRKLSRQENLILMESYGDALRSLKELDYIMAIDLAVRKKLIGILLLGPKKSRDPFYAEEISLFRSIADYLAALVEMSRLYAEQGRLVTQLQIANKAKSDFIGVVSHQFRTPLSVILWNAELLEEAERGSGTLQDKAGFIAAIRESVTFLTGTLSNIFDVLEVDGSGLALYQRPLFISEILNKAIEKNESLAKMYNVKVEFDRVGTQGKEVLADENKIFKVFSIILQNAILYHKREGSGRVLINVADETKDGSHGVVIRIQDDGIGIAKENIGRIFDKFFRGENAKKFVPDGTGLGLFIVKHFIERHGGDIRVQSVEGRGTTFSVFLPYNKDKAEDALSTSPQQLNVQSV